MPRLHDLIALLRPTHWTKNVFVLMPVPFALAAGAQISAARLLLGLVAFSLAASAVYALNDALDAPRDRLHPRKKHRPVAAGRVAPSLAYALAAGLAGSALLGVGLGGEAAPVVMLALYLALHVVYSFGGKHVPMVDVFLLASGFVLRVLFGCALIGVTPSNWLLLCSSSLALLLGLAKRRADVVEGMSSEHRPVLSGYDRGFLDQAMTLAAATTVLSYALYCLEAEVMVPGRELAGLPFVVFGVLDYLRVASVDGAGGEPVETILSSPALLLAGVGWAAATFWSIQLP